MKYFIETLPQNILNSFKGKNLVWHLLAWSLTAIIVMSGFDWYYFTVTRGLYLDWVWLPAGILGMVLPVLVPLILYFFGKLKNNSKIINVAFALGQAVILGSFVSYFYKAFTGRIPPDFYNTLVDISHGFRFGFWEGGIFWGWPSSHTTVAFAMAITFFILYSEKKKVKYLAIIYALYIGFGASIGFHWFSEFIAGAIIGSVIGTVVGKSFRSKLIETQVF